MRPGTSHADGERVVVNLIDTNTNAVLYGWLVDVHVTFPSVSATFDVSLPIGRPCAAPRRTRVPLSERRRREIGEEEDPVPERLQRAEDVQVREQQPDAPARPHRDGAYRRPRRGQFGGCFVWPKGDAA